MFTKAEKAVLGILCLEGLAGVVFSRLCYKKVVNYQQAIVNGYKRGYRKGKNDAYQEIFFSDKYEVKSRIQH